MQEKMVRFLRSIGIEEIEDFDLDFVLVGRNPHQKERVDMVVSKVMPWEYALLERLVEAMGNIRYPYSIRFTYLNDPTPDHVVSLLADWHLSHYRSLPQSTYEVCFIHLPCVQNSLNLFMVKPCECHQTTVVIEPPQL